MQRTRVNGPRSALVGSVVYGALAILPTTKIIAADTPPEYQAAVTQAEQRGAALFAADSTGAPVDDAATVRAKARIHDACDLTYRAVTVSSEAGSAVYLIGEAADPKSMVIGRHFRISDNEVVPSTRSCLTMPADAANGKTRVAVVVTHLLSPTPSDFHVYLSLRYPSPPLMVATCAGNWMVSKGKIEFGEPRAACQPTASKTTQRPVDHPVTLSDRGAIERHDAELQPLIEQARRSYPAVKARFRQGLPAGSHLLVVKRLTDSEGHMEQSFIAVDAVSDTATQGRVWGPLSLLRNIHDGDRVEVLDTELIDWVIVDAAGHEEGNIVGKYLDQTGQPH